MNFSFSSIKSFNLYIFFIFIFSIIILSTKFLHPTDWTTSEWLINYQGGFTRRGLIGELLISMNKIIDINPRYLVYIFEIIMLLIYYYLVVNYIKQISFSPLIILIIFSPLSFIYPVAETETIARKETLLLSVYIYFLLSLLTNNLRLTFLIISILLPLMNLIWDGTIFYIFFFILTYIYSKRKIDPKQLIYFLISFIPLLISLYFILITDNTQAEIKIMCEAIKEPCFGAMNFVVNNIKDNISNSFWLYNSDGSLNFKLEYLFRYSLVFILCFYPIFSLILNSNNKKILLIQYITCLIPIIVLFYLAWDWGRYLHILYLFSVFTIIFLIKKDIIKFEKNSFDNFLKKKIIDKKYFLITLIFFIYTFSWYPKVLVNDDIGSLPYIRIIDNILEIIF